MTPLEIALYALLGFGATGYGTLIGAGGGFIIVPALMLLVGYSAGNAAGTSIAVVFVNAIASMVVYGRQGRIDYRTGGLLAVATIPGAIMGAYLAAGLDRRAFGLLFGVVMVAVALFILFRPPAATRTLPEGTATALPWRLHRQFTDASGQRFEYVYNPVVALAICFGIGFLSSMLGIGGGIMLTPALIMVFGVPAHVASATAQVVLLVSAGFGAASHYTLDHINFLHAAPMVVGAIAGSQVGAAIARRIEAAALVRALAIGLLVVGVRLAVG